MGLRFLFGKSGSKKSDWILKDIQNKLHKEKFGKPILYIVPDQMTFQQEYKLFKDYEIKGSIRAQVMSISRLALRILQETGGSTRQFISSVGVQMMLRKIIEEKKVDFKVFEKAVDKIGFLPQLEQLISEFKRHDITPEILQGQRDRINEFTHQTIGEKSLVNKLSDLSYIFAALNEALAGKYMDGEDRIDLFLEQIEQSEEIRGAEIYIDGFHRFTPKELRVIEALMKVSSEMTIALTMEGGQITNPSELDLFFQPMNTYEQIRKIARNNNIVITDTLHLDMAEDYQANYPHYVHLEQNFDRRPAPAYEGTAPIQIAEAVHPRAEVEGVAQKILSLVRDKDYRFNDMVLFVRNPEGYHDLIHTIFADYRIPVFIDEKRTMLNHPLIEFLRSVLEVVDSNWRYDALFRVLKTGLIQATRKDSPLTKEAIDELENYVLEYGIRNKGQWLSEEEWLYQRFFGFDQQVQTDEHLEKQGKINAYRQQVTEVLAPFDERIRSAKTIRDFCEALYLLLEDLQVPEQLEDLRKIYENEKNAEKAREQEQVWDGVIQLFDEYVEIAGEEELSLPTFRETLDAGFETLQFAHVPPTMDHVIVASIDRSRISGKSCAFLLGVNEGYWPLKPPADGLMSEEEREIMASFGIELAESSRRKLLDDWFYMYLAFTTAHKYLWLSYSLSDEEGDTRFPSQLIQRIGELFPVNEEVLLLQDPDEKIDADRFITTPEKTRAALTQQLSRRERGQDADAIWLYVLNWYITKEAKTSPTRRILQSIYYENLPKSLPKEIVEEMYPKREIRTSVSRLEMFYGCSYRHFAQFNLGLEERQVYTFEAPDIGSLFHEALKVITEWVQEKEEGFASVTKEEAEAYAKKSVEQLAPIINHQILASSNRYKYIQRKLKEVIARATFILSEQARASEFTPVGIELGFGLPGSELRPKEITLSNGYKVILRGRIDRVDQAQINDELYLRIIDYKSSKTRLDLLEVYYGLALQMLAYLDVVLSQSEEWLQIKATPAGVLYFHVHNPLLSKSGEMPEDEIDEEIFKEYKLQGLILDDVTVAKRMDTTLDSGYSQIIPAAITKTGNFYSNVRVTSEEMFASLRAYIDQLIKQAGILMTTGDVQLNPYVYKNRTACTYCPFDSVCQFDPALKEHNFRRLVDIDEEEILKQLQGEED